MMPFSNLNETNGVGGNNLVKQGTKTVYEKLTEKERKNFPTCRRYVMFVVVLKLK